jgi:hypothetical protein
MSIISEECDMNKFLLLLLACVVLVPSAIAASTPCPTGPYTLYLVPNFSCTINGTLMYVNFGNGNGTGNPTGIAIPASAVTVTPITTINNEGFQFSSGWNVATQMGMNSFQDNLITFAVVGRILDLHLTFNGSQTGSGVAGVAENFCINQTTGTAGCPQGNSGQLNVTNPPGIFNSDLTFTGNVTSISIAKDINVSSGVNGTAAISQVINTFSAPEPLSFVLLGSGLLGLGLLRKRFYKR